MLGMLTMTSMQGVAFLAKFFSAVWERKITEAIGAKKVWGVCPDRLAIKNCSFIWTCTGQTLETEHFSPAFDVFDPLGFEICLEKKKKRA